MGVTAYAWLIYLSFFFVQPASHHAGWREWLITFLGGFTFAVLYFIGYWVRGRQLLGVIAAITFLGVGFVPFNSGASVFFVFAAYFGAFIGDSRSCARVLAALVAVTGIEGWLLHLGLRFWALTSVVSVVVGFTSFHFVQKNQLNRRLRRAQEEIEHLAQLAERARIARDLHDVLGHTLSTIILKATLANRLAGQDAERQRTEIQDIEQISREALSEVRAVVSGYRGSGIATELTRAETTLRSAGVVTGCCVEQVALSPIQETVLALAIREGVTNVIRHAHARTCRLNLSLQEGACLLEISDDGCGGSEFEGNGLSGMRERIKALGGTLSRKRGSGTVLRITLPL
ncbi:MAG: sensor histidine kinase [Candidatus Acidiferrales bacterium]